MELNSGYKDTDIGLVPVAWDVVPLSDLLEFRNGVNADKGAYGHGIPFINVLEVLTRSHLRASDIPGRVALNRRVVEPYVVRFGDVLFNRTSETQEDVGLAAVYCDSEPVVFGGFVIRGRPKNGRLDPIFAGYGLRAKPIRDQLAAMGQGAIRANIGQRELGKVLVPVPPLLEQRTIAIALREVDALLAALETLIAKKRALKQAAMQDLLTGKRRLHPFQGQWERRTIGSIAECATGGTPPTGTARFWGGEVRWMSSGELRHKRVRDVLGRITEAGLRGSNAKLLPPGCVLVGLAGQGKTRGTVAINTVELCTNQSIAAILPNATFSPEYLFYSLERRYDELRALSSGDGGRGGLNLGIIKGLEISLPTLPEQTAIAAVLSDIDAEIEALGARLEKTRLLKQGLMQELLTGRIRLK